MLKRYFKEMWAERDNLIWLILHLWLWYALGFIALRALGID